MPITYTASTTMVASAATASADTAAATYHSGSSGLPGTGWTYATGSAPIPATSVAADWIAIEFYLGAGVGLWVCSTAVMIGSITTPLAGQTVLAASSGAANGTSVIFMPAGQSQPTVMGNLQPTPNWNAQNGVITYYDGYTNSGTPKINGSANFDQSEAVNFTCQAGFSGSHNAGHWPLVRTTSRLSRPPRQPGM